MKKIWLLRIFLIVIVFLGAMVFAGCNTDNNTANINSSYDAIRAVHVKNPSNGEISFIYDAINNQISGYPKTVPNFINLPVASIIDVVGTDERMNINYVDDDNYENGIIIAQEPKAGAAWNDGIVVNLTVNRKYSDINSRSGYIGKSLDKLYFLTNNYNTQQGKIWVNNSLIDTDTEIIKLQVDNGSLYYNDSSGVNIFDLQRTSQILGNEIITFSVFNEKIYYRAKDTDGKLYCFDIKDKTNSLIFDDLIMFTYINSDYIICHNPHDIYILDANSYEIIKHMHYEYGDIITGCSLDSDNVYILHYKIDNSNVESCEITKYNIPQDEQTKIYETSKGVLGLQAIDDKIIFQYYLDGKNGFRYIDMRNMENKFFTVNEYEVSRIFDDIDDVLFDGQQIIYKKKDHTFYSICIFTGETKKIELSS